MKLSVIITTYNSGKYIVSCIDSLLIALNNFIDYEIIIIDNDSHDQTISLLDKFNNKKIKIINLQFNRGYSQAVNTAISESRLGKILILL